MCFLRFFLIFNKITIDEIAVTAMITSYPIGNEEGDAGEKAKYSPNKL